MERSPADERRLIQKLLGGAFEIERTLGSGAQGVVYLAVQRSLDRQVVVKVCRATDGSQRAEFRREADILMQVGHPSVLQLLDFGFAEQWVYLVYPFAAGETLKDRLADRGTLPWPEAARIGLEVAQGLAHVHSRGVIHRDIKPSNVWLPIDGPAQLIDFGTGFLEAGPRITAMGTIKATFPYASPEQLLEGVIDRRADICSWGRMMYEMLSGSNPYLGSTLEDCINRILNIPPGDLPPLAHEVPRRLDLLVRQAMEKEIEDRPQSAVELEDELAQILHSAGAPGSRSGPIPAPGLGTAAIPRDKYQFQPTSLDDSSLGETQVVEEPRHRLMIGAVLVTLSLAMLGSLSRPPPTRLPSSPADPASPARIEAGSMSPESVPLVGIVDIDQSATDRSIHLRLRTLEPVDLELKVTPGERRIPSARTEASAAWHRFDFGAVPDRRHEVHFVSPGGKIRFVPDRIEVRTISGVAFEGERRRAEKSAQQDSQLADLIDRFKEPAPVGSIEGWALLNNRSELFRSRNPFLWTADARKIFEDALTVYRAEEVRHRDVLAFSAAAATALEPESAVGRAVVSQLARFLEPPGDSAEANNVLQRFMRNADVVQALCRMGSRQALEVVQQFTVSGWRSWVDRRPVLGDYRTEMRRQILRVIVYHQPGLALELRGMFLGSSDRDDRIAAEMVKAWQGRMAWEDWLAAVTSEDPEMRTSMVRILLEARFAAPPPGLDWPWKPTVPPSIVSAYYDAVLLGLWGGPVAASGLATIEDLARSDSRHRLHHEEVLLAMGSAGEAPLVTRLAERLEKAGSPAVRNAAARGLLVHLFREKVGRSAPSRETEDLASNVLRIVDTPTVAVQPDPGGPRLLLRAICGGAIADPAAAKAPVGPENYAWWVQGLAHLIAYRSPTSDPENRLKGWNLVRDLLVRPLPAGFRGGVYLLDPATSGIDTRIEVSVGDRLYLQAAGLILEYPTDGEGGEPRVLLPPAGFQAGASIGRDTIGLEWSETPPLHLSALGSHTVRDGGRIRLSAGTFDRDHFTAPQPGFAHKFCGTILMRLEVEPRGSGQGP